MATYSVRELEAIYSTPLASSHRLSITSEWHLLRVTLRNRKCKASMASVTPGSGGQRTVLRCRHFTSSGNLVYMQRAETCRGADKRS